MKEQKRRYKWTVGTVSYQLEESADGSLALWESTVADMDSPYHPVESMAPYAATIARELLGWVCGESTGDME